jgi:hypothetical protein
MTEINTFENRVLTIVFGPKRKILQNEELHNFYSSSDTIIMIKSAGKMRREERNPYRFWWESQKERNLSKDLDVRVRVILKLILQKFDGAV